MSSKIITKGESDKERQDRCQAQLFEKQKMLQKMFTQTEEIDKIKQIRHAKKNDDQFFKLQNELVSNIKRQKDKLIKMKSFLKQLTIKLEQDEEQKSYFLQNQTQFKRPSTTHNTGFQKDPQLLQSRLDNCKNQIQITKQQINYEQEMGDNLQQESIQIFKINNSLKKKFEQSQDVEYIQKVKFQNLENFSMKIQQKQVISNINLYRCQKEFDEMKKSEDRGKEKKNDFNQSLKNSVKVGVESISKNLIQQDDLKIQIQHQYSEIKCIQQRLDQSTKSQYNSQEKKNQVKTILWLKQIFITSNPYAFVQKLERDNKLLDNIFDKTAQVDKSETVDTFFKNHTFEDLNNITNQIIKIFGDMHYKMTSLKNEYMEQSQQYIKFKEKYEKCHSQLQEIIDKNLFIAGIGDNPQKQQLYEKTYFDFVSVDSGLITNNQNNHLETINIMIINRQEQDSEIVKFTNVTYEQEYLLLAFYNAVQLLLKRFNQDFQIIYDNLQVDIPSGYIICIKSLIKQNDTIIDYFANNINNEVSIEAMTVNKEEIDRKLKNIEQPTRIKLIKIIQNNSLYYSMLNSDSLEEFCKSINKDIKIDQIMGNLADLAYQQCQIKVKEIFHLILETHNILKEEGQATIKKIKLINLYESTSENRKENLSEHVQKSNPIYSKLKKTHEIIVKRLEDRKDNKNEQLEDQEIFKSTEIKLTKQDDYENLKMLIDTTCLMQQDQIPANNFFKSQKKSIQFDLQNKFQHEKNDEQIKSNQDFIQFQREKMKELIAETDRPVENQVQAVSKQLQMVNDHLLMKNQFKNENIKKMKQDLKYIQKIDKLYNLSKGQLEKESVYLQTQQDRKEIQRSIQQDSQLIDNEICLRISTIQTAASLNRKKEIIFQRQKIRDAQTQDLFYRSMHQYQDHNHKQKKLKSASNKYVPNITELKSYF